jgi:hypothetical protein
VDDTRCRASGKSRLRRFATDADHDMISRQMDEAFFWNVSRDKVIRATLARLRREKPDAPLWERERIILEITAKYRMLRDRARSAPEPIM